MIFERLGDVALKMSLACCAILTALTGCSQQPTSCPAIIDHVETLAQRHAAGIHYHLVRRITGWHDKTIVIQLFDKEPKYNSCNEDMVKPIFEDSLSEDFDSLVLEANIKTKRFDVKANNNNESNSWKLKIIN